MAFCEQCGAQLAGDERFCEKCGHDLNASRAAEGAPIAPIAPVAAPPAMVPPVAPYPQFYPAAGQIPVVAMPQAAPRRHGWIWWLIIIAAVLFGLWWIGTHDQQSQQPGTAPRPAVAQPAGPNAALVKQQVFTSQWRLLNADVQIYNQKWDNQSNVAIKLADLECDQYDQHSSLLAQKHIPLTEDKDGELKPGYYETFNDLDIGPVAQGMTSVNCAIVDVTPAQ
jgi:hypothetical protein